ncbi:hypothetical protein B9Z55_015554 [Caenorhabditis nigoni]|uniref:F-box domain-containing protein n=1 Tax=Caenorhabditis nigoni TaxID=1611254 RepID=A0A2G5UAS1_9PELO|nr:hypothetical protein B9Z55_015554 [Caenorhabditis nigoni]
MEEPPRIPKFRLLKYPFPLREEVIRNMEFMDAFYFSTLSKRSKRLVHNAKYPVISIDFMFETNSKDDRIRVATDDDLLNISLSDSNVPPVRYPNTFDGLKLASLINEPSDDYRRKLSAHLLFLFHFKEVSVHIERNIEHLHDLFLWSIRKTFHCIFVWPTRSISMKPEDLQFVLNSLESKTYCLNFSLDDSNYKYRESLGCENLDVDGSTQWLDTDDFLKRNPQMKELYIDDLPGKQVNDLLKQWINGKVIDLKNMYFFNPAGYPDEVILDGIVTMETKLTEQQAKNRLEDLDDGDNMVDIQRKIDGQFATVIFSPGGCFVEISHE